MNWLSKIFGKGSAKKDPGISIQPPYWRVKPIRDLTAFLLALDILTPPDSILYLEGGTPPKDILNFLENHAAQNTTKLALGTIWPRPLIFHMPINSGNLKGLAQLTEKCATPEAAIHLHVYKDNKVLLQWYDAFFDDPFYITKEIPEDKLKQFCAKLNTQYEDAPENV